MLLYIYCILVTIAWAATSLYLLINSRKVRYLRSLTTAHPKERLAIIIAVRNEEAELEQALRSVCALEYEPKRIVVVNDRSTDATGEILQKMKEQYPVLSIISIEELPAGWLGKNNALYQGYLATDDDWMLFTDADVKFRPHALTKAMTFASSTRLDHLTVLPQIISRSRTFHSILDTFKLMLEIRQRPWAVKDPNSKASIGVGAFNLVRRTAYEKAGTHQVIALRPDDDLKLGERIKAAGLKQDVLYGDDEVWLQWYSSLEEFIKGLMKNTFAVSNYSLTLAFTTAAGIILFFSLPLPVMLLFGDPLLWSLALVMALFQLPLFIYKRGMQGKWWYTFMMPVAGAVMAYIIIRSALLTMKQGGIFWRESFYSLEELKRNK